MDNRTFSCSFCPAGIAAGDCSNHDVKVAIRHHYRTMHPTLTKSQIYKASGTKRAAHLKAKGYYTERAKRQVRDTEEKHMALATAAGHIPVKVTPDWPTYGSNGAFTAKTLQQTTRNVITCTQCRALHRTYASECNGTPATRAGRSHGVQRWVAWRRLNSPNLSIFAKAWGSTIAACNVMYNTPECKRPWLQMLETQRKNKLWNETKAIRVAKEKKKARGKKKVKMPMRKNSRSY